MTNKKPQARRASHASTPLASDVSLVGSLRGGAGRASQGPPMLKPVRVRSLHDYVMHELGRRIVAGELRPGEVLPREESLAEHLDVSRTALREALKVLSAKGLVESKPKVGTRVREPRFWQQLDADVLAWRCASMPTDDFVRKLAEMREVIEPAAAAVAATRCDSDQLEALDAAYTAMDVSTTLDEWAQADLAFHEAMLRATNNELMVSLFSVVESALGTFFVLSARTAKSNFKYSLPHHKKVLDAVSRHHPEAARRAMQRLVDDSRANMTRRKRRTRKA
jgi:DNA-binding FadR family transcriptional regulator